MSSIERGKLFAASMGFMALAVGLWFGFGVMKVAFGCMSLLTSFVLVLMCGENRR